MSTERILVVAAGTAGMLALLLARRKRYPEIPLWKLALIGLLLGIFGTLGSMVLSYIEAGRWGGTSFFGAVLGMPLMMLPAAFLLKIHWGKVMDLCAPAGCFILSFMKLDCIRKGCCGGIQLGLIQGQPVYFPSREAEILLGVILLCILLRMEKQGKQNVLYPWYLILYGGTRFFLNWFRSGAKPFFWILPSGNCWALCAVFFGILWLLKLQKQTDS